METAVTISEEESYPLRKDKKFMDSKINIGKVIRAERKKQNITLDEASRKTGVSSAMLGQIERNESSPTLSPVWKISAGLRIPMATLLAQNKNKDYKVNKLSDVEPVAEKDCHIKVYNLFPFDPLAAFDYLYIVQDPGYIYPSTGHPNAIEEYVVVTSGKLDMHIAGKVYPMEAGDSITFAGNEEHAYENASDQPVIYQSMMRY